MEDIAAKGQPRAIRGGLLNGVAMGGIFVIFGVQLWYGLWLAANGHLFSLELERDSSGCIQYDPFLFMDKIMVPAFTLPSYHPSLLFMDKIMVAGMATPTVAIPCHGHTHLGLLHVRPSRPSLHMGDDVTGYHPSGAHHGRLHGDDDGLGHGHDGHRRQVGERRRQAGDAIYI